MTITDLFQIRTYAEELYTQTAIGGDIGSAPLRVWPGMALTACLVLAGLALCSQLSPADSAASMRPRHVFQLRSWRWPALALVLLVVTLLWLVPVGNLVYQAGMVVEQTDSGRERHWSPAKVLEVLVNLRVRYQREFADTAVVGIVAATAAVVAAVPLAWVARLGGWRALPAVLISAALLAIPGPVFGVSLIWLMNRPEHPWLVALYDDRFFAPNLALTARALPLAILVLWHALRSVPADTLEMAATQGAGALRRWLRIGLPQRWAALPVAWLISLAIAWGDLGTSVLVVPPGTNTLAILISGLSHFGVDDQLAGISLFVLATCAGVGLSVLRLTRRLKP